MGIEDERLVLDYLSRVGDLAHGTDMSAAERRALVGKLRAEIGRQRTAAGGASSRAEVRRILDKMGRPEDVVAAASESGGDDPATPAAGRAASVPAPRAPGPSGPSQPSEESDPRPDGNPDVPEAPVVRPAIDEDSSRWPDGPIGRFVGGIEIPELLGPGDARGAAAEDVEEQGYVAEGEDDGGDTEDGRTRTSLRKTRRRPNLVPEDETDGADGDAGDEGAAGAPKGTEKAGKAGKARARRPWPKPSRLRLRPRVRRVGGPVEWLAALLLLAGTFSGIVLLGLGWLVAYWSPRLSRRAAQWATFGMPTLVAGGYAAWIAARANGYFGAPLADGGASNAFADHWPWLVRAAALASAALLIHLARRPRPTGDE